MFKLLHKFASVTLISALFLPNSVSKVMSVVSDLLSSVFFGIGNVWHSFWQLIWGLFDQTHYHLAAFKLHLGISYNIVTHYFKSIPRHFMTHYCHQCYLKDLGFAGENDLVDIGTIVWNKKAPHDSTISPPEDNSMNKNILKRSVTSITGMKGNKSGNPAHVSLASLSLQQLWHYLSQLDHFNFTSSIFVDFGSGTGLAVLSAITQPFMEVIGVELDATSSEMAQRNLTKFKCSKQAPHMIRCDNVLLRCADMRDFDFTKLCTSSDTSLTSKPLTSSTNTVVLYMYEPLWTLSVQDAHKLYMEILTKARDSKLNVLVTYFDCGLFSGNALTALTELGAKQIHKSPAHSLEFGTNGHMWVFRL